MSIISSYYIDRSDSLAKRFAELVTSYIDDPSAATKSAARVPLENLFRILEMFRYESFADENRRGVLAMDGFGTKSEFEQTESWHAKIEAALNASLTSAFANVAKNDAINELQDSLRSLAQGHSAPERLQRTRGFFSRFQQLV